jgi:hypothetical protein
LVSRKVDVTANNVPIAAVGGIGKMLWGTTQSKLIELKKRTSNFLEKEN